jgi:hypothetical protein
MKSQRSRALVCSVVGVFALLAPLGCGPSAPAAAPGSNATANPPAAPVEAAPDLTPVAAPDDLVVVGRLARPRLLLDTTASWVGLPARLGDIIPKEYKAVEAVVAWDSPIEIAAVLDRHSTEKVALPIAVVTIGLTSVNAALDVARDRGLSPTRVAPGVYRVALDDDITCAVAASLGPSPARLVCSGEWKQVEELLPYATRGLPKEKLGNEDLHIELRGAALQRRYSQEISALRLLTGLLLRQAQTDSPRVDRALTDLAYGLADELKTVALELDRIELSARLDETHKFMELSTTLAFAKDSSFTAQMLDVAARRATVAPEAFFGLPGSAEGASFSVGGDPKLFAQAVTPVAELVDAYLEQQKAGIALRRRVRQVLEALPSFVVPSVQAQGSTPAPEKASAIERARYGFGWGVGITETRADNFTKVLSDLEGLVADRDFARLLKERASVEAHRIPKLSHHTVAVRGFQPRATVFNVALPPSLWASWGLVKRSEAPGAKAGKATEKPLPAVAAIFVADGERTWISWGADEKASIARLEAARAGTGGTLRDMKALAPLASAKVTAGGFWTLANLLRSADSALRARGLDAGQLFNQAPNHGLTPQLIQMVVTQTNGAPAVRTSVQVPEGVFQDLGSIVPAVVASSKLEAE